MKRNGKFIISLDFELFWGVRDKRNIEDYKSNILGVQQVIPKLLNIFDQYNIKATFATVGFLFCETKDELLTNIPIVKPLYKNQNLSPYNGYFDNIGADYHFDKFHFAPNLIKEIRKYNQEIATHTFSHYYCLEEGQTIEAFKSDIETAMQVAKKYAIHLQSLVFPRNQFNDEYLNVCADLGIICYRGNEESWIYRARNDENETKLRRAFRLIDSYFNISGHNCYPDEYLKMKYPINIPASRFLRPFSKKLKIFDILRINRIKSDMTYAAKNNLTYHLWWHPHNFGANQYENFYILEKILKHYKFLNNKYGFQSYAMGELAMKLKNER